VLDRAQRYTAGITDCRPDVSLARNARNAAAAAAAAAAHVSSLPRRQSVSQSVTCVGGARGLHAEWVSERVSSRPPPSPPSADRRKEMYQQQLQQQLELRPTRRYSPTPTRVSWLNTTACKLPSSVQGRKSRRITIPTGYPETPHNWVIAGWMH